MKQLYTVLALALVLAVAFWAPAQAGVLPGGDLDNPGYGNGGVVDDGDHPWGGDEVIGGGGDKNYRISIFTGIPVVDAVISALTNLAYAEEPMAATRVTQSATLSSPDFAQKQTPAMITSRKHFISLRKER